MAKYTTAPGRTHASRRGLALIGCCALLTLGGCDAETSSSGEDVSHPAARGVGTEAPTETGSVSDPEAAEAAEAVEETTGASLASQSEHDDADRTSRPVEALPAAVLAPEAVDDESADELVVPVIETTSRLLSDPIGLDAAGLESVAADESLAQARAQTAEYSVMGWRQVGSPQVVSARVLELSESSEPPRVEVEVCLDHSAVDLLDASGRSMVNPDAPMRVLTIFVLEFRDGGWVATDQQFPVETTC